MDIALPAPIDEHLYQVDSNSDDTSTDEDDDDHSDDFDSDEEDEEDDDDDVVDLHVDNGARVEGQGDEGMSSQSTTNNPLITMKGVRDSIKPELKDSYFVVNIDGRRKYLQKSTAVWYLTDEKHKLSADRVTRVMDGK